MTNTTKITKAMAINGILSAIATLDTDVTFEGVTVSDMTAYCNNELALLAKKKAGTSKAAIERAETRNTLAEIVFDVLTEIGKPVTVSEMQTACNRLRVAENGEPISNQRVTSVCYSLVEKGIITNTKDKKKSYFAITGTSKAAIERAETGNTGADIVLKILTENNYQNQK